MLFVIIYKMKLQILITQYKEDEKILDPMLNSISIQQGINFDDIEVIIANDGSDIKLSQAYLNSFPYSIKYIQCEHSGLPGCRKHLFEASNSDYIMFCDADDMFLSNIALSMILMIASKGLDCLICDFMEEVKAKDTIAYVPHKQDETFVHGKVYRRQFLIDNNIVWYPELKCHEDSAYNILAIKLAKNKQVCSLPLYLWKWRDNSICRADPLYILKTYVHMIHSNQKLIDDFISRGRLDDARYYFLSNVYNTYFMLNKKIWLDPMNVKYRYDTELRFKQHYNRYKELFLGAPPSVHAKLIRGIKNRVITEGVMLEKFTFDEWINHIEELE